MREQIAVSENMRIKVKITNTKTKTITITITEIITKTKLKIKQKLTRIINSSLLMFLTLSTASTSHPLAIKSRVASNSSDIREMTEGVNPFCKNSRSN